MVNGLLPGRGARGRGPAGLGPGAAGFGPGAACLASGGVAAAAGTSGVCGAGGAAGAGAAGAGGSPAAAGTSVTAGGAGVAAGAGGVAAGGAAASAVSAALAAAALAAAGLADGLPAGLGADGFPPGLAASCFGAAGASAATASRNFFTTGGSTVDDAERTNSPRSFSFLRTSLLSMSSSFASSYTRTFATALLLGPGHGARNRQPVFMLISRCSSSALDHVTAPSVRPSPPVSTSGRVPRGSAGQRMRPPAR